MTHTINIKQIGSHPGTVGWLGTQIDQGNIVISEGLTTKGVLALWVEWMGHIMCLASYNNGMYDGMNAGYQPMTIQDYDEHGLPWVSEDSIGLTDAARQTLRTIAQQWCDVRNSERDSDVSVKYNVMLSLESSITKTTATEECFIET